MTIVPTPDQSLAVMDRILADYRELPLCLTSAQAARLWQLEGASAVTVLDRLVEKGYLQRQGERYTRASRQAAGQELCPSSCVVAT